MSQAVKEGGIRLFASRLCHKALSPFLEYGSTIFFELDLRVSPNQPPKAAPFMLFQANVNDASRLLKASDVSRTEDQIEGRFQQGQMCFAACDDTGRIVHSTWCSAQRACIEELNREIVLEPDEVYVYDSYTKPDCRGKGASKALRVFMVEVLNRKGYKRLVAFVRGNNAPMLHGVRSSHRRIERLFYLRFRGGLPIVIGRSKRQLRIPVPSDRPPVLIDIPVAIEKVQSAVASDSKRSVAASAGSQGE